MPGQRLLIVDNDRAFLKEHQAGLEAAFDVEVAPSPDTAMERLESGAFACVLISVEIADNRGYALCASIRRSSKLAGVKVGLISAKATGDEFKRHQGLKGRADLYLMKPIPPSSLVEALRPLVPSRGVDPDNPLGDLADDGDLGGDLGDDWLGDLKSDLDLGLSHPDVPEHAAGTVALSAAQIQAALAAVPLPASPANAPSAQATAPPGTLKPDMAAAQMAHLQEELAAKNLKLRETEEALVQLQRQFNSVTVNLDEVERGKKESAGLQAKLESAEAAVAKHQAATTQFKEEITGLEATVRGQGRQLAQMQDSINELEARLKKAEESASKSAAALKAAEEAKTALAKDIETAMRDGKASRLELEEAKSRHERERMELMGGLDLKEAELNRHKEQLKSAQEVSAERGEKLKALASLLEELGEKLHKGTGLATE